MRRLALSISLVLLATAGAAAESRLERALRKLAPAERLMVLCDDTAMVQVRKDGDGFRPDRAVANAMADTRITGNTLVAEGGAFRSRGKWYGIAYTCSATPDNMTVLSFSYRIGAEIPESKWAAYGLWQ